jgi:hypothetical protein
MCFLVSSVSSGEFFNFHVEVSRWPPTPPHTRNFVSNGNPNPDPGLEGSDVFKNIR